MDNRLKCSRCRAIITKESGCHRSISKCVFRLKPEIKEVFYCDKCNGHNRQYRGRTTEEMLQAGRPQLEKQCKTFSQDEIDSVAHLYSRSGITAKAKPFASNENGVF